MGAVRLVTRSRLAGKTLALRRFNGRASDYEAVLRPLIDDVDHLVINAPLGTCYWKNIPRLLLSLQDATRALTMAGAGTSIREAHQYVKAADENVCGNAKLFFEKFK